MAVTPITPTVIPQGSILPIYTTVNATDTYTFRNDGRCFLHVKKTGANACTVTIITGRTLNGLTIADRTVTVAATTGDKMIGPFDPNIYNDGDGLVTFSFSEATGLTAGVLQLPIASRF